MQASRKNKTPIEVTRRKTKFSSALVNYLTQEYFFKTRAETEHAHCMCTNLNVYSLKYRFILTENEV